MGNEQQLGPQTFDEFIGGGNSKAILRIQCQSAKKTGNMPGHFCLNSSAGLGKTTLARIMANELGGQLVEMVASNLQQPEQLTSVLVGLEEKSILFIDEIHQLPLRVEELLYPAMNFEPVTVMQTGFSDLMKNLGMTQQKPVRVTAPIPPFTLCGATTMAGNISAPLRSRFPHTLTLDPYSIDELSEIVINASVKMNFKVSKKVCVEIAKRSRATARTSLSNLKWLHEFCTATNMNANLEAVMEAFALKEIDENGLTKTDRLYLKILFDAKGVVGLSTLSVTLGEDTKTIEDTIEPFLLKGGFIRKSARGRLLSDRGFDLFSAKRKLKVA